METNELTPMLRQFYDLKKKHPDAVLLFRCGDFYETYCEDAGVAAKVLGITLTKSSKTKDKDGKPLAMAGFPYHALDTYLPKLIRAGLRVAICDQIELPNKPSQKCEGNARANTNGNENNKPMNDKELNLAVCSRMEEIAKEVFENEIEMLNVGTFTTSEMADNGSRRCSCIWNYKAKDETVKVEVGEFKCEFNRSDAFLMLNKFYSLCSAQTKRRITFTKSEEFADVCLDAEFEMTDAVRKASGFVSNDTIRPAMQCVCIDIETGYAVATDGHRLYAVPVRVKVNKVSDGADETIFISAKDIRLLANGACRVVSGKKKDDRVDSVTDGQGHSVTCCHYKFPAWTKVWPQLDEKAAVTLADSPSLLGKFLKSAKKSADTVTLYAKRGYAELYASIQDTETKKVTEASFLLTAPADRNIKVSLDIRNLESYVAEWNGKIYISTDTSAVVLDGKTAFSRCLIMPRLGSHVDLKCDYVPFTSSASTVEEMKAESDRLLALMQTKTQSKTQTKAKPQAPKAEAKPQIPHTKTQTKTQIEPEYYECDECYSRTLLNIGAYFHPGKGWTFENCDPETVDVVKSIIAA